MICLFVVLGMSEREFAERYPNAYHRWVVDCEIKRLEAREKFAREYAISHGRAIHALFFKK